MNKQRKHQKRNEKRDLNLLLKFDKNKYLEIKETQHEHSEFITAYVPTRDENWNRTYFSGTPITKEGVCTFK